MKVKDLLRDWRLWVLRAEKGPNWYDLHISSRLPGLVADWGATQDPHNPDEVDVPPSVLERLKSAPDELASVNASEWARLVTKYLHGRKIVEIGPGKNPISLQELPLSKKIGLKVYYIQPVTSLWLSALIGLAGKGSRFSLIKRIWITEGLYDLGEKELDMLRGANLVVSRCVFPHLAQKENLSEALKIVKRFLAERGVLMFNFPPYILSRGEFIPTEEYLKRTGWEVLEKRETPMCCALRSPLFSGWIYVLQRRGEGEELEGRLPLYPRDKLMEYYREINNMIEKDRIEWEVKEK